MGTAKTRKEEILQVALAEFTREGYAGARLQSIADKTGVTKAMIHYYFKTKENLFRQTYGGVCNKLMSGLFTPLEKKNTLFSKVEAFVDEVINRFEQQPQQAEFLINELNQHSDITLELFQESYESDFFVLNKQLQQAADSYKIAPVNSSQLIGNILSLCIFSYTGRSFLREILHEDDAQYEMFLNERREVIKDTIINWLSG